MPNFPLQLCCWCSVAMSWVRNPRLVYHQLLMKLTRHLLWHDVTADGTWTVILPKHLLLLHMLLSIFLPRAGLRIKKGQWKQDIQINWLLYLNVCLSTSRISKSYLWTTCRRCTTNLPAKVPQIGNNRRKRSISAKLCGPTGDGSNRFYRRHLSKGLLEHKVSCLQIW